MSEAKGLTPDESVNLSSVALTGDNKIEYKVKGRPAFAFVDVYFKPGQKILADYGAMLWMDGDIDIMTYCTGGWCAACWRSCAREGCCQNTFTGPAHGRGIASFGFKLPGDMLPFVCAPGKGWLLSPGGFVCGTNNVSVNARFMGCCFCCFAGEGAWLTLVRSSDSNPCMFFAGKYGCLEHHDIPEGGEFIVDPGLFFACNEDATVSIGLAAVCVTCCCGNQGVVIRFKGPCRVTTKSRDPWIFQEGLDEHRERKQQGGDGKQGFHTGSRELDMTIACCKTIRVCLKRLLRRRRT